MINIRPDYEALDGKGYPYVRKARIIGELPCTKSRSAALREAVGSISVEVGALAIGPITFGSMVGDAFMPRHEAKKHQAARLLMLKGEMIPLDYCESYR